MKSPPCICCGKELVNLAEEWGKDWGNQPDSATCFATEGHYGSTAFDPMDGSRLEINVCDDCLNSAKANGRVLHPDGYVVRTNLKIWS